MKAIVCEKPGLLVAAARPEPQRGADEAIIAIRRVGICGTDYHIYEGSHPYLQYPRVLGHELAGEVIEAPSGGGLRVGQTVVVNPYVACGGCLACRNGKPNCCMRIAVFGVHRDGGMCEAIAAPVSNLYPVEGLGFDEAASVEFLAIGAHAVARSALRPGSRVLVVGAGPIGLGVALFAQASGGATTVMDRDAERLEFAQSIGVASSVVLADARALERVRDATASDGYDVVFDATGAKASMEAAFAYVAHGGALVLVSVISDTVTFSDPEFHKREMTVTGTRNALRVDFERVIDALRAGKAPLRDLITHRTTLADVVGDLRAGRLRSAAWSRRCWKSHDTPHLPIRHEPTTSSRSTA